MCRSQPIRCENARSTDSYAKNQQRLSGVDDCGRSHKTTSNNDVTSRLFLSSRNVLLGGTEGLLLSVLSLLALLATSSLDLLQGSVLQFDNINNLQVIVRGYLDCIYIFARHEEVNNTNIQPGHFYKTLSIEQTKSQALRILIVELSRFGTQ